MSSNPIASQQEAIKLLRTADITLVAAQHKLEEMSPLMTNSTVYVELGKLSRKLNELMASVNSLRVT